MELITNNIGSSSGPGLALMLYRGPGAANLIDLSFLVNGKEPTGKVGVISDSTSTAVNVPQELETITYGIPINNPQLSTPIETVEVSAFIQAQDNNIIFCTPVALASRISPTSQTQPTQGGTTPLLITNQRGPTNILRGGPPGGGNNPTLCGAGGGCPNGCTILNDPQCPPSSLCNTITIAPGPYYSNCGSNLCPNTPTRSQTEYIAFDIINPNQLTIQSMNVQVNLYYLYSFQNLGSSYQGTASQLLSFTPPYVLAVPDITHASNPNQPVTFSGSPILGIISITPNILNPQGGIISCQITDTENFIAT